MDFKHKLENTMVSKVNQKEKGELHFTVVQPR